MSRSKSYIIHNRNVINAVYINGDWRTGPMEMKSETRVGLTFDAGVDITVNKQFSIITGLNYNLTNLTSKKFFDQTISVSNEVALEDDNKTLSSINLYLGVSLYLGAQ